MNLYTNLSSTNNYKFVGTAYSSTPISNTGNIGKVGLKLPTPLSVDTFIKSTHNTYSPNFGNTSRGRFLKSLRNITDPYSGAKILTPNEYEEYKATVPLIQDTQTKILRLSKYEENMRPVEKNIYKLFVNEMLRFNKESRKDSDISSYYKRLLKPNNLKIKLKGNSQNQVGVGSNVLQNTKRPPSFSSILMVHKDNALNGLIKEQTTIFDSIENSAQNMYPKHKALVMEELKEARERILLPDDDIHHFKRKMFINKLVVHQQFGILKDISRATKRLPEEERQKVLDELDATRDILLTKEPDTGLNGLTPVDLVKQLQVKYIPESLNKPNEYTPILDLANKLPNSNTSVNAFIVKYADRSEREIGERLLSSSIASIEHILPDSLGGENEASNFILTTAGSNFERGNIPHKDFLKLYPKIPKYTQQYMNDIINAGNNGNLYDHEWYPYVVQPTIEKVTGIKTNISKYRISPGKAFMTLPTRLHTKYPEYERSYAYAIEKAKKNHTKPSVDIDDDD